MDSRFNCTAFDLYPFHGVDEEELLEPGYFSEKNHLEVRNVNREDPRPRNANPHIIHG